MAGKLFLPHSGEGVEEAGEGNGHLLGFGEATTGRVSRKTGRRIAKAAPSGSNPGPIDWKGTYF